jgi:xanthine dehydrogenase accessory factor
LNERLFARLADWLTREPVVLASILSTRGATPRKTGARMLVSATDTDGSIGGGLAEARVIAAARELLDRGEQTLEVPIDLSGGVGAAGVCGGYMRLALRRWEGVIDARRTQDVAARLSDGMEVELDANDVGSADGVAIIAPNPRLLIVGGGHCGQALYELASALDFELLVYDPRPEYADPAQYPHARTLSGDCVNLRAALATRRALYVVLLNRDYVSDVAALRVLAGSTFAIREVLAALDPVESKQLAALQAPVGLPIGAETPEEIAVSVLAHLIQVRSASR